MDKPLNQNKMKEKTKAIIFLLFVLGVFSYGMIELVIHVWRGVF